MDAEARIQIATLDGRVSATLERIGAVDQSAKSAHGRIDKLELLIREDLQRIQMSVSNVEGWMNRSKGWAAAGILIGGAIIGALLKYGFDRLLKG